MMYRRLGALMIALLMTGSLWSQNLTVSPATLNFAPTDETQTDSLSLTLSNPGSEPLRIEALRFFDTYGQPAFSTSVDSLTLPAGGSQSLWVYFQPRHNVIHNSELLIQTDAATGDLSVDLQGQGTYRLSYYSSTQNLSEQALKNALRSRLSQGYVSLGYRNARDEMFMDIDNQRTNGQGASVNTLACVYTGTQVNSYSSRTDAQNQGFNTEHTFPQGLFDRDEPMRSDLFHLYPTTVSSNSRRANFPFGVVSNAQWEVGGSKEGSGVFEPRDSQKGPVARAMFYFVIRYQNYSNFLNSQEGILRQWHAAYPPDAAEQRRNDDVAALQNNRNPFIDYPQLLERISSVSSNSVADEAKQLILSRERVDFGSVPVGESRTFRWVLVNPGHAPATLENLAFDAPELSFSGLSGSDTTLAPGEALPIGVTFTPGVVGSFQGNLTFSSDAEGPEIISLSILANATTSLPEASLSQGWQVYPNPVHGTLHLRSPSPRPFHGQLIDGQGRLLQQWQQSQPCRELSFDLSHLPQGRYWLQIEGQAAWPVWVD